MRRRLALLLAWVHAQAAAGEIVGIDLGTTYSCVGVYRNGAVEIIPNDLGNRVTPSVVAFTEDGTLVGEAARVQASLRPENTVYDAKRIIGRAFTDSDVQTDMQHLPFKVVDSSGKAAVQVVIGGTAKTLEAAEISAMVLQKMKQTAENFLGSKVTSAVVTVPAYFNDAQRQATKDAGTIAGLDVARIINEPTAAAIAYGLDSKEDVQTVLVFDLGGGTLDVSILGIDSGILEVMATNGDTHLGGEDFDTQLVRHLLRAIKAKHGVDLSARKDAVSKLRHEVERAKRVLSTAHTVRVEVDNIADGLDVSETITRARFEELCSDLFKRTIAPVRKALEDADLRKADIDEVVLVGGSTRIPRIQSMLKDFFNGKEPNKGINPDEAIAYGAAVQGAILAGVRDEVTSDLLLLDIAPLTLGIETTGGVMDKLVPRNTRIPITKTKEYTTAFHNQDAVSNKVYEGERTLTKDNRLLGEFELRGFPKMRKGEAKIEVTFEVNADGILKVSAREKTSDTQAEITVTGSVKLSEKDIVRMTKDAETYALEDDEAKKRAMQHNRLTIDVMDALYDATDNEETAELWSEEDKAAVKAEVQRARDWLADHGADTDIAETDEEHARFGRAVAAITDKYKPPPPPPPEPVEDEDDDGSAKVEIDANEDGEGENEDRGGAAGKDEV